MEYYIGMAITFPLSIIVNFLQTWSLFCTLDHQLSHVSQLHLISLICYYAHQHQ